MSSIGSRAVGFARRALKLSTGAYFVDNINAHTLVRVIIFPDEVGDLSM
jgi:hypothetical protein